VDFDWLVGDDDRVSPWRADSVGVYSIGAVARMLDIAAPTLRAWEERYAQIVPSRSAGGQRLYSRDQVDQLRFVREQIESGLQPADAHRVLAERRQELGSAAIPPDSVMVDDDRAAISILLAERDPYAADFAEFFLRTEGYRSRVLLDASQVQQEVEEDRPHVLVVDLMISGGSGLALCRSIRASSAIPILAVSAVASGDEAIEAGADAFLMKPLEPLQFVSTVRDLLGTSAYLRRRAVTR
jgi:DNA-binding transcriptional MerR regulator